MYCHACSQSNNFFRRLAGYLLVCTLHLLQPKPWHCWRVLYIPENVNWKLKVHTNHYKRSKWIWTCLISVFISLHSMYVTFYIRSHKTLFRIELPKSWFNLQAMVQWFAFHRSHSSKCIKCVATLFRKNICLIK